MSRMNHLLLSLATLLALLLDVRATDPAKPVATTTLHNVFQLDGGLFSGSSPDTTESFRELQKLGVKTIISVDGSKPNLALARQFSMRYVHLPIGYGGVPKSRALELTKAVQINHAAGPIYLHCHHGKHRGPAAAAVICRAIQGWSAEQAAEFLQLAGTSPDYAGLFRDVRAALPPSTDELSRLPADFPETAKTPGIVEAMVAIDEHFDALKAAQKNGWRAIPEHPDLPPAQPATLLWELLLEHHRDPETQKRGADYTARLADSERAADTLRRLLRDPASDQAARDAAFLRTGKTCGACHRSHRN